MVGIVDGAVVVAEKSLFVQLHEAFGREILKDLNEQKMLKSLDGKPLIEL